MQTKCTKVILESRLFNPFFADAALPVVSAFGASNHKSADDLDLFSVQKGQGIFGRVGDDLSVHDPVGRSHGVPAQGVKGYHPHQKLPLFHLPLQHLLFYNMYWLSHYRIHQKIDAGWRGI